MTGPFSGAGARREEHTWNGEEDIVAKITHVCVAILLVLITTLPAGARYLEMLRAAAYHEGVPDSLMLAIAWVESQGVLTALNIDGAPVFPTTWDEGRGLILQHARENIDVGVMQVNVPSWGHRFGLSASTLYQPQVNIPLAALILRHCIEGSAGDLWKGVACYHSQTAGRQQQYVQKIWSAYRWLKNQGIFGPLVACAAEEDLGRYGATCAVPRRRDTRPQPRPVISGSVPLRSLDDAVPGSASLPHCPGGEPQYQTHYGMRQQTLLFFSPDQEGVEELVTEGRAIGMCVGCLPSRLPAYGSRTATFPVYIASAGLLQELGVDCVPTVVVLSPYASAGGGR